MPEYVIKDFELGGKKTKVTAPGIIEAMHEYLPWPTVELRIHWRPFTGTCDVEDLQTNFKYDVFIN